MNLADLHCDTLTEVFDKKEGLASNSCDVALDRAACYRKYLQVGAIFTSPKLTDDEGFERFTAVCDYTEALAADGSFRLCRTGADIDAAFAEGKSAWVLAVEDGRILGCNIDRLDALYRRGVRIMTPLWGGLTSMGGSFDTDAPLSDFGHKAIEACFDIGIIPDISHASYEAAEEIITMAEKRGKPVIASHSDAFSVNPHRRNLRDEHFRRISALGGLVGINLCPPHVTDGHCDSDAVVMHITHYLEMSNGHDIALGCDLDGIGHHPDGLNHVGELTHLAEVMGKAGIGETAASRIFFDNAYEFMIKNLK